MLVDLHTHSTASDGTYHPNELVERAKLLGLEVLAITDHDTISAFEQLNEKYYDDPKILVVKGVEISAEYVTDSLHILGYNFKDDAMIQRVLKELLDYRNKRNEMILEKMNAHGFHATMDELRRIARGEAIGRPHFARLMLEKGYVKSLDEAFEKYLADGGIFFVEKRRLKPAEAIELIKSAGGIAVLAHPYELLRGKPSGENDWDYLENMVKTLVRNGLDGLEVFYSTHTMTQTDDLLRLAKKYGLLVTAGSDYHGGNRPGVSLGMNVPYKLLRPFLERLG
ncbi:PHP domain-containing protein [Fervidobacterium thailandense]|uniref:Phosphatase n=1 Tax=Fervidobacterium thailandense TaxID=1008305 RepID=A0A1E3G0T4_9BACT|nr:PHP domain-containing protein [Fervidobacterium thailandense]ODN29861.1 phosphatase [Fervidobacterium thailandense]